MSAQERTQRARDAARTRWNNVRRSDGQSLPDNVEERLAGVVADSPLNDAPLTASQDRAVSELLRRCR
jgi:hypothetical protein